MSHMLLLIAVLGQSGPNTAWTVTGYTRGASDPAIIKSGDRYYYYIFSSGRGIPVRVSSDLHHWERNAPVFAALPQWARDKVPGATGFWAPDISFRDGRYWLYYSVSTWGSRRSVIGLATNATLDAADPQFQWQDEGLVWETRESDDYNAIDPNAVEGPDGELYLAFGSFWTGLKMVPLDRATGKPQPGAELKPIAARPRAEAIEGAFIVRRGAYHYLFCSHDFTGRGLESTYKVVVGRGSAVTGPFVDRAGRPMLEGGGTTVVANDAHWRGPGHNAVLQDGDKTWLVYHALDPTRNAALTLRIDTVRWTEDGWPEVDQPAPPVHGWWEHGVTDEPATTIRLLPDGKIDAPGDPASWALAGDALELRWPDPAAPGGVRVDRCTVSADRRSYSGRDPLGREIRGRLSVIGWWEHRVANGAATMIRLLPGGTINNPDDVATWTFAGDTLELRWPNAAAPGGVWIDVVRLSADGSAYEGRNQNGIRISGWQVASE
jgi:arabinan endo-1,5-alpha-L-arabinosidase